MRIIPLSVSSKYRNFKRIATNPEVLADVITKGGYSAFKDIATIAGRPDIPHAHMLESGVQLPPIYSYAYLRGLEKKVAIIRSVCLKVKQELFRNGGDWQPRFVQKCADENCGEELQESVEECPRCRGTDFLMPSTMGKDDFEKIIHKANVNGQTLLEVFAEIEEDLNVGDDAYIVTPKRILMDTGEGRPMLWPTEVFRGDPDLFRKVTDRKGIPGGRYWKCLRCKDKDGQPIIVEELNRAKAKARRCPSGHELYEVFYVATDYQGTEPRYYYIEGEVFHTSKYSPSLLYGFAPILTLYNEAMSLFHMDRRMRMRFQKGRAEGIILIPTKNETSLNKAKKRMAEEKQADESYLAMLATDPEAKHQPTFLQLLGSFGDNQVLEIKQNLKEVIGSLYGVSLIFQADASTGGGLHNEGLQVKVTDRAVERGQAIYNDKLLPWLMKQYGVIDMIWLLNPNEEQDMAADLDLRSKEISNATAMLRLGYVADLKDNGKFEFTYDPDFALELLAGGAGGALQAPIDTGQELLPATKPIDLKRRDSDIRDSISKRDDMEKFIDPSTQEILDALNEGALFDTFKGMSSADITKVRSVMLESMTQPQGWSINSVVKNLREALPQKLHKNIRAITRTETQSIRNVSRKIGYEKRDPEGVFKFQWIGPQDNRTTGICKNIVRRVGEGVSLERLEKIINEESVKGGFEPRPMMPHINCRFTPRRVVSA